MAKSIKRQAETWIYVIEKDRALPPEQQSRFTFRPLTFSERALVRDTMAVDGASRVYRTAGELLLDHLLSVDNFPVEHPKPWPSDRDARMQYLELLDDADVLELGNEIWLRSSLGRDETIVKNSSPPERTSSSGGISPETTPSTPVEGATSSPP
jgi:hypothetical protein